jgi:copper chaperone CopZ
MPILRTALPLAPLGCAGAERLTIERVLRDDAGVLEVSVNPVTEMAYVEYDPSRTDPDALFGVLRRAGFAPADRVAVRRPRAVHGRGQWTW